MAKDRNYYSSFQYPDLRKIEMLQTLPQIWRKSRQPGMLATLALSSLAAFLIQFSGAGLTYIAQILLARWMGPTGYGDYIYAFNWAQLLAVFGGLGFTTGILRFIPSYIEGRDWGRLRGIVRRTSQLTLGVAFLLAILGTALLLLWQPPKVNVATLLIGMWLVPLLASMNLGTEMIRATKRVALAYAPPLLLQPLMVVAIAFLVLHAAGALSSLASVLAMSLATLVVLAVQFWGIRRSLPSPGGGVAPVYETAHWLRVSFPLLLVAGFFILLKRADILMIGMFMGPKDAGIYEAATRTATLVAFVLMAVNAIAAPMIASYHSKGDYVSLQRMVSAAVKWMFWPSLAMTVALVLLGGPVLGLFGPEFRQGQWALRILALGQLVSASAGPVAYLMSLTGHQNVTARVFGVSALVNIALNAALIPLWGLAGAATATAATMILWNLWLFGLVKRHLGIRSLVFWAS